jgi:hypothetical protein
VSIKRRHSSVKNFLHCTQFTQYKKPQATTDRTIHYLADYGHVDILIGSDSVNTVKSIELDWMNDRL